MIPVPPRQDKPWEELAAEERAPGRWRCFHCGAERITPAPAPCWSCGEMLPADLRTISSPFQQRLTERSWKNPLQPLWRVAGLIVIPLLLIALIYLVKAPLLAIFMPLLTFPALSSTWLGPVDALNKDCP
ncbi:MAG: hypothetical protein L0215_12835 [Gemmataceae bacterium]|nr:hypothetical protein [Gemmataceae bacterium]